MMKKSYQMACIAGAVMFSFCGCAKPHDILKDVKTTYFVGESAESEEDTQYEEDTNRYGNTAGNLSNMNGGALVLDDEGCAYFYNMNSESTCYTQMQTGELTTLPELVTYLNYIDGKLYGVTDISETAQIVMIESYDAEYVVLREEPARSLQVVNDMMYYQDATDGTLRKMSITGGEETILVDELCFYPVVYKDRIYFQKDGDIESLYSMALDGSDMTKINDVRSYMPVIHRDKIIYMAQENGVYSLRRMDLNGENEEILDPSNVGYINVHQDKLYYVSEEDVSTMRCIDLMSEDLEIQDISLDEQIKKALRKSYGKENVPDFELVTIGSINFAGDYCLMLAEIEVNGENYIDEYFYNLATDEIYVMNDTYLVTDVLQD